MSTSDAHDRSAPAPATSARSARSTEPLPARARGALLPDARLGPGRRGRSCRRRCWPPGAGSTLRGPRLAAHLAVPDRDEPLPERAARRAGRGRAARPLPSAEPTRERAAVARAVPGRAARGVADARRPGGALRDRGGGRARVRDRRSSTCRRASARCSCCATCSASAPPRSPSMLETHRGRGQQRAAAGAGDARGAAAGAARRAPRAARRRRARAAWRRFADALERGDIDAHGRAADRRRLADDAARAARVPGPRRDRRVPARRRRLARRPRHSGSCRRGPTASRRSAATCATARAGSRAPAG